MKKSSLKTVFILLAVLCMLPPSAGAQLSGYRTISFDLRDISRDKERVIRTIDSSRYLAMGVDNSIGQYLLVDCRANSSTFVELGLPEEYMFTDFNVVGDYAVFSGYYAITTAPYFLGIVGYLHIPPAWSPGVSYTMQVYESTDVDALFKVDGSYDPEYNHLHIMATSGSNITYVDVDLASPATAPICVWEITSDNLFDVVCTDKYFALVGQEKSSRKLCVYRALKSDLASFHEFTVFNRDEYAVQLTNDQVSFTHLRGEDINVACIGRDASSSTDQLYYYTIDLTSGVVQHAQTILCSDPFRQPLEMVYVNELDRVVSIVTRLVGGAEVSHNIMLCIDPYPESSYTALEYHKNDCRYASIDVTLGHYAVAFGHNHVLLQDVTPVQILSSGVCDTFGKLTSKLVEEPVNAPSFARKALRSIAYRAGGCTPALRALINPCNDPIR